MPAISVRRQGVALVVGGDIHATAASTMLRTGARDLRANPVHIALSGTLGTDELAFPSAFRGVLPAPPARLDLRQEIEPIEENGFMIADVRRDRIVLRFFRQHSRTQREQEIDRLQPFRVMELPAG